MKWRQLLCAFTFHTWTLVGVRGPFVLRVCSFCKREHWSVFP